MIVMGAFAVSTLGQAAGDPFHARDRERCHTQDHKDDHVSLYVSSDNTDSVLVYDGKTGAFVREFVAAGSGGLIEPEGITFGPDGNLYVSSRSDEVLRYDGKTGAFIGVFASGHRLVDPAGIAFGGPDNDLFVSSGLTDDGRGNQILRFDGRTGAFKAVVDPHNKAGLDDPEALVFGCDGLLYVASTPEEGPGEVLRYNPANNRFVDKFVRKKKSNIEDPTGLIFGPDGDLFLSSAATSEVMRYDGKTGKFKGVFVTEGLGGLDEAEGIAFGANASSATPCWSTTAPPASSSGSSSRRGTAFRNRRSHLRALCKVMAIRGISGYNDP